MTKKHISKIVYIYIFCELYKNKIIKSRNINCDCITWGEIRFKLMHIVKTIFNNKIISLNNEYGNNCIVNNIKFSGNLLTLLLSFSPINLRSHFFNSIINGFNTNFLNNDYIDYTFYYPYVGIRLDFNMADFYSYGQTGEINIKENLDSIINSIINIPNQIDILFNFLIYIKDKLYNKKDADIKINLYDVYLYSRNGMFQDYINANRKDKIKNILNNIFDNNSLDVLKQIELDFCFNYNTSYYFHNETCEADIALRKAFSDNGIYFDANYNLIRNESTSLIFTIGEINE